MKVLITHGLQQRITVHSFFKNTTSTPSLGPTQPLLFKGYQVSYPGVKRPRCDVDHSPPAKAEVKNECMYTSISHIRLHGVERDVTSTSITNNNATQCRRWRGGAGTNYRGPAFRKGPRTSLCYISLSLGIPVVYVTMK